MVRIALQMTVTVSNPAYSSVIGAASPRKLVAAARCESAGLVYWFGVCDLDKCMLTEVVVTGSNPDCMSIKLILCRATNTKTNKLIAYYDTRPLEESSV